MSVTLTTRIPEELADAIEAISEEEQLDKSAVAGRRRERAFERYASGSLSLEGLAREAGIPLREALAELRDRDITFHYSEDSLAENLPDA